MGAVWLKAKPFWGEEFSFHWLWSVSTAWIGHWSINLMMKGSHRGSCRGSFPGINWSLLCSVEHLSEAPRKTHHKPQGTETRGKGAFSGFSGVSKSFMPKKGIIPSVTQYSLNYSRGTQPHEKGAAFLFGLEFWCFFRNNHGFWGLLVFLKIIFTSWPFLLENSFHERLEIKGRREACEIWRTGGEVLLLFFPEGNKAEPNQPNSLEKQTFIAHQLVLNELHPPGPGAGGSLAGTVSFLPVCGNCSPFVTAPPATVTQHLLRAHLMVMKFLLTMIKFHKAPEDNLRCAGAENETFGLVH